MSAETRRCPGCGAEAPRAEARFCEHCGASLAAAEPAPPPPDPFGDVVARFQALARHPELPALLAATPEVPELAGRTLPSLLLLAFLGALGLFASILCLQVCPPIGFVPLALVVIGVVVVVRRLVWNARTPMRSRSAMVIELRSRVQAGAEHSPAHTRHFAGLRFEDGSTGDHECFASVLETLEPGALGVAYLKGQYLASFARLAA